MNGHGGKRSGSGRHAGSLTVRTRKIAEEAIKDGMSPLEVMLENMRFAHHGAAGCLDVLIKSHDASPIEKFNTYNEMLRLRAIAQESAKDAAPYMHPRLAAVEHTGANGGPIETVSKIQRDAAVLAATNADT